MSRFDCEAEEATAPRMGCGCRACYRAREAALDPRLIEVIRDAWKPGIVTVGPGSEIVRRAVDGYLAGRVEWAALYVEIIRALLEANERLFKQVTDILNRQPMGVFLPDKLFPSDKS